VKVLIISAAFPPMKTGDAAHAFHLSQHLSERGLDVHVLTTHSNRAADGLPFKVYPEMQGWAWSDMPHLAKFLRRCAPDAIILVYVGWNYHYHPMVTFAPTLAKKILPRVPFITQFEIDSGAQPHRTSFVSRACLKAVRSVSRGVDYAFGTLLRDSDRIIVLCEHHRATLVKRWADVTHKSTLIPPPPLIYICPDSDGTVRQRGREKLGVLADDFLLVYFGYLYPSKGVEVLLEAVQKASGRHGNVRLAVVGGVPRNFSASYFEEVRSLAERLGIGERVVWTGECSCETEEASTYLRASDACVLPFDSGVQLNNSSFASAAAHGLPVITTRHAQLESQFEHERNVLLCPPQDAGALAEAITALMEQRDLRERLRAGAQKLTQEWFSWDKAVERTIAIFNGSGHP
jgi:glycosyltransferase involved in cell wall biosynthesis